MRPKITLFWKNPGDRVLIAVEVLGWLVGTFRQGKYVSSSCF
jgi:hypothetical protein